MGQVEAVGHSGSRRVAPWGALCCTAVSHLVSAPSTLQMPHRGTVGVTPWGNPCLPPSPPKAAPNQPLLLDAFYWPTEVVGLGGSVGQLGVWGDGWRARASLLVEALLVEKEKKGA